MSLGTLKKAYPGRYGTALVQIDSNELARMVESVVKAEGPIHIQEVGRRLRTFLNYPKISNRIRERVKKAVQRAVDENKVRFSYAILK